MTSGLADHLVLAVYATSKGFAFVLFEGPESPFDWGVKTVSGNSKNTKITEAVESLIGTYQPSVLVVEDTSDRLSRSTTRIRRLYRSLADIAAAQVVEVCRYPKATVGKTFAAVGATTKYEIARAISRHIPAFASRLPRVRKPWMSQDPRQSLFDAAALGLTYYALHMPSPYHDHAGGES